MLLKNDIEAKFDILIRQYEKYNIIHMIEASRRQLKDFFSNNVNLQEEVLISIKGHLNDRIWEGYGIGLGFENPLYPTYYADNYVDDFNNFSEFYEFLESLVKDVEEYHKLRIEKMKD